MSLFSFFFLKKKKISELKEKKKKRKKKKNNNNNRRPLAKSLTIIDLLLAPMHGSQLQVAYQGVLDANSEPAVGKAYSNCEAIPCDQFEVAFQAVELWIAD